MYGDSRTTWGHDEPACESESLRELLARCAAGDATALAKLYDGTIESAWALALTVTRDRRLAEAALRLAYTEVWRKAGRFRNEDGSVRSWVLALVHRWAHAQRTGSPIPPG